MNPILDEVEARVLGALIEKSMATPEYYPMTRNSLTNACNQKSNRDPVMSLPENQVVKAIDSLKIKQCVTQVYLAGSRVPKYAQKAGECFEVQPQELAVIATLLLRGPQTPGEIKAHVGRMHMFADIHEVDRTLRQLAEREEPLVVELPVQPGRREARFQHTLLIEQTGHDSAAPVEQPAATSEVAIDTAPAPAVSGIAELRAEVDELKETVLQLRQDFESFRKAFE